MTLTMWLIACGTGPREGVLALDEVWLEAFRRFDTDGSGAIDSTEYARFAGGGRRDFPDRDGSGDIDVSELVACLSTRVPWERRGAAPADDPGTASAQLDPNGGWIHSAPVENKAAPAREGPPNILLISMDTVRADRMHTYGHSAPNTPTLDRLAQGGTLFERAFSQANESVYSHGTLLTGRYASEIALPVYATYALPADALLAPEILANYGYRSAAFVAGGHIGSAFGTNQGWDVFHGEEGFASFWHTAPRALAWLRDQDGTRPWFAFVHSYDAHRPLKAPGPFKHLFNEAQGSELAELIAMRALVPDQIFNRTYFPSFNLSTFTHANDTVISSMETFRRIATYTAPDARTVTAADVAHVRNHYDAAIAYADLQLGIFLAYARAEGHLDNTVVLVVGDHGEDLFEHNYYNHRTGLWDSCTRVPTIAWGPGFAAGKRHAGLVEARDLLPTITDIAGATLPAALGGRSLREVASGAAPPLQEVFMEGVGGMLAVRTPEDKLIANDLDLADPALANLLAAAPLDPRRFGLYDLVADPGEQTNLLVGPSDAASARAEVLRAALVAWRRRVQIGTYGLPQSAVSPEVVEAMQTHGYWTAPPTPTPPRDRPGAR